LYDQHVSGQVASLNFKVFGFLAFASMALGAVAMRVYRWCVRGGGGDTFSEAELAFLALESNDDDVLSVSSSDVLLRKKERHSKTSKSNHKKVREEADPKSARRKEKNRGRGSIPPPHGSKGHSRNMHGAERAAGGSARHKQSPSSR
jgi:hypothetical protein